MPITFNSAASTASARSSEALNGSLKNGRFSDSPELTRIAQGQTTLSTGAKGDAVVRVQTALLDMGFAMRPYTGTSGRLVGGVDGDFGGQTSRALVNFQKHAQHLFPGVTPTGAVDAATLKALDSLAPRPGKKATDPGETPVAPRPWWRNDPSQPLRVVVVKDEHRTFLYSPEGKVQGIFANSIGARSTPTESGLKKVTGKLGLQEARSVGRNLWGDEKAFGVRILDLSWINGKRSGEELHGTFADSKLGMDVSHGCMRHHNEDILTLFSALSVGDRVAVVDKIDAIELGRPINFRG